jgi:hypothetical protein
MKAQSYNIVKYVADEGMVFDYRFPKFAKNEEGVEVQIHYNKKTLYIGNNDSIDNYIEISEVH